MFVSTGHPSESIDPKIVYNIVYHLSFQLEMSTSQYERFQKVHRQLNLSFRKIMLFPFLIGQHHKEEKDLTYYTVQH